jgi:asparaginyl-tRNA synthetase
LTVSGQLHAEIIACALSKVYTFGPTFRAEDSNTRRHLAEFWMVEAEQAHLTTLQELTDLTTDNIKSVTQYMLSHCAEEMSFLNQWVHFCFAFLLLFCFFWIRCVLSISVSFFVFFCFLFFVCFFSLQVAPNKEKLEKVVKRPFHSMSYTNAIIQLQKKQNEGANKFQFKPVWGESLQTEHERFICEVSLHPLNPNLLLFEI